MRILWSAWLLGCAAPLSAAPPPDVADRLLHSTAWVRTTTQGVGTGWVVDVDQRRLITNLHVVGDQDRVEVFFPATRDGRLITERHYYLENQKQLHEEGRAVRGRVILRSESTDLALVELERIPRDVRSLPLSRLEPVPGQAVHSMGQRHDSDALWVYAAGVVRQQGKLTDGYFWRGKKLAIGAPCCLTQSPIHPGDSGGPLVNDDGEVVGVLSGVRWQSPLTAIAIQAREAAALLAEADKKAPVLPTEADAVPPYAKLLNAAVWVRPTATEGRAAGWIVDRERRLVLTTAAATGGLDHLEVALPRFDNDRLVPELDAYGDRIGLRQSGLLVRGIVVIRDSPRGLALLQLQSLPARMQALPFANDEPRAADRVHGISNPSGVEMLWLYSAGVVRQTAAVELVPPTLGEGVKVRSHLLQLPHQGGSSGGPVVNDRGELIAMMSAREAAQQQLGYAIAASELQAFLRRARALVQPETAEEHRRRGLWLLQRGQPTLAAEAFAAAARIRPPGPDDSRAIFDAMLQAGDADHAAASADALAASNQPEDLARRALALALQGKRDESAAVCKAVIEKDRKLALAFLARGMLKEGKDSLADLDEAIFLGPNLAEAYRRRARVHAALGDADAAIADWSRAIELAPLDADSIRARSHLYLQQNDPRRAVADCERLVELRPADAAAHLGLAEAWLARDDEAKAIAPLTAALRWEPARRNAILKLALRHAKELIRRWPDDPAKKTQWLEASLRMLRDADREPELRRKADALLKSRDPAWDAVRWGEALERGMADLAK